MIATNRNISLYLPAKHQAGREDERPVSTAAQSSEDTLAQLQSRYSRQLYSTIFRITRNREDAEDALQDTFLRAYLALGSFEGRSSVYSWLTRIAINSALMLLRKRRNHPELPFDLSSEQETELPQFELKDSRPNPEQIYDQRQRCANIESAIGRLHFSLRAPLQTRIKHGSSLEEIAQTLEISEAAVKARLYRARARLNGTRVVANANGKQRAVAMR
jgi:RNA polymerase sigma-70 factor (ECF subfamily)